MRFLARHVAALLVVIVAACGDSGSTIPADCNPLGGQGCLMPWPSISYETTDATAATGYRLDVPIGAMPVNIDGVVVDPATINRWDGFSPTGELVAAFPTGVAGDNLPGFANPDASLAPDSPIVLLDMDTGERAPFFAEIDQNEPDVPDRDLIIRPLARLHPGAHYAVAIRNTVTAPDGSALAVPAAFAALRDGNDFDHPRFAALRAGAGDLFAALATAGVDKHELVLAWDFTTASDDFLTADLLAMRAAAVPAMGTNGANLTFVATAQPNTAVTYKMYLGTFKSPTFLTDGEQDDSILARDASGTPVMSGLRDANFAAIVPSCVTTAQLPVPVVVFGHGLFGSAEDYITDDFTQTLADQLCVVIVAGDFIGLTSRQTQLAPLAVNDMNRANQISEKLGQSMIDFMALETIARGPMSTSPEFSYNGTPVMDTSRVYYVGGSLGGIMGNTFMAYDPNITRAVLAVPGGDWSLMFERAFAWNILKGAAQGAYPVAPYYQLNLALLAMAMEPYDPITTAAHVIADPLPDTPAKNILIWYSDGDCHVTNLSTQLVARTMGIPLLAPSVESPWQLTAMTAPLPNAVNPFDDHPTPLPPTTNVPPAVDNGTHSGINKKPAAIRLAHQFLLGGSAIPQCMVNDAPAPCDCATGACN